MAKAQITGSRAAEATYVEGKGSAIEILDIKSKCWSDTKAKGKLPCERSRHSSVAYD